MYMFSHKVSKEKVHIKYGGGFYSLENNSPPQSVINNLKVCALRAGRRELFLGFFLLLNWRKKLIFRENFRMANFPFDENFSTPPPPHIIKVPPRTGNK